jgi:hypothetical protein
MTRPTRRRTWRRPLLWGLTLFALFCAIVFYVFVFEWTDVSQVAPHESDSYFQAALAETGGGMPYIEFDENGVIVVHRELETENAPAFDTLTLVAWAPGDERAVRVHYPRWFVYLKTSTSVNLGTMIAVVRKDWNHLDLSISYDDLSRRGPALLLNHKADNGARLLIWTSSNQ